MKNLKRFGELDEEKAPNVSPEQEESLKAFNEACERFDFFGAFEIAQTEGLFGGDFEEYMESRKNSGSAFGKMIKLYEEYIKISSQLKDLIISDMEDAQNEYGH